MLTNKLVIVTGANKGIGFALVEKLLTHPNKPKIILTSRNPSLGEQAFQTLTTKHPTEKERLFYQELDIDSSSSIAEFSYWLYNTHQTYDILINNAGIGDVNDIMGAKGYVMPPEQVKRTIQTNFYSTVDFTESMLPFLSNEGKMVFESSIVGRFSFQGKPIKEFLSDSSLTKEKLFGKMKEFEEKAVNNEHVSAGFGKSVYGVSKAFLNAYVKWVLLPQLKEDQTCFSVYPGWCKTNLGTEKAPMTAEEGTYSTMRVLDMEKEESKKLNGGFFDEKGKTTSY